MSVGADVESAGAPVAARPGDVWADASGRPESASVCTADGRWVQLHSRRDPQGEADRLVAPAFAAGEPRSVVLIGLGLGYALDAIERRSSRTRVLGLEPLHAAPALMQRRRDLREWTASHRLTLLSGPGYEGSRDAFRAIDGDLGQAHVIVHPVVDREFPAEAARARALVESIVAGARANDEARRRFAGPYLLNTLRNVPVVAREADAAALMGALAGQPALVVAPGPSLDRNLAAVARLGERAVVIAVDTALRPLLAAGIRPHLVVAVDPQEANARHLLGLSDVHGIGFVAEASLSPRVFPAFAGQTFCFKVSDHEPWRWLRRFGLDRVSLEAWGSVITTAFDLACRAGCGPIVFAGADLAYTNGLLYCRNTTYEPDWRHMQSDDERAAAFESLVRQKSTTAATDVHGRDVMTTPHFAQFRDWLVSRADEAAGTRVLNGTGAGILVGGRIEQVDLGTVELGAAAAASDARRTIEAAWARSVESRAASDDGPIPHDLVREVTALFESGPAVDTRATIDSWRAFAAGGVTESECLATLLGSLPADGRREIASRLRQWVGAHPFDVERRRLWTAACRSASCCQYDARHHVVAALPGASRLRIRLPMHLLTDALPVLVSGQRPRAHALSLIDRRAPFVLLYQTLTRLGYDVGDFAADECDRYVSWTARHIPERARDKAVILEVAWLPRAAYQVSPVGSNAQGHFAQRATFGPRSNDETRDVVRRLAGLRDEYAQAINAPVVDHLRERLPAPFLLVAFQPSNALSLEASKTPFASYYSPTGSRNVDLAQACIDAIEASRPNLPVVYKQHPFDQTERIGDLLTTSGTVIGNEDDCSIHEIFATGSCRGVVSISSNATHDAAVWDVPAICLDPLVWPPDATPRPFPGSLADIASLDTWSPGVTPATLAYLWHLLRQQWVLTDFQDGRMVEALIESRGSCEPFALRQHFGLAATADESTPSWRHSGDLAPGAARTWS